MVTDYKCTIKSMSERLIVTENSRIDTESGQLTQCCSHIGWRVNIMADGATSRSFKHHTRGCTSICIKHNIITLIQILERAGAEGINLSYVRN